jgi:hypothetical protein
MSAVLKAIILFTLAQLFAWFQLNSQYIWEWWRGKAFISALTWGIPCSMCFYYAWTTAADAMQSVWSARFIGSSVGIVIFPILTYALLGESMFTTKTMICFGLALLVVIIQIFF